VTGYLTLFIPGGGADSSDSYQISIIETKSSTEYSVAFLVESKKFKLLRLHLCCRFRAANSVGTTLEFAAVPISNIAELVPSGFFLSTTMVFAAVRTHFSRKTTACLVKGTAINEQPFKYNKEHVLLRSGRLDEWLE